jgi:hypothetical protein
MPQCIHTQHNNKGKKKKIVNHINELHTMDENNNKQ